MFRAWADNITQVSGIRAEEEPCEGFEDKRHATCKLAEDLVPFIAVFDRVMVHLQRADTDHLPSAGIRRILGRNGWNEALGKNTEEIIRWTGLCERKFGIKIGQAKAGENVMGDGSDDDEWIDVPAIGFTLIEDDWVQVD